MVQRLDRAEGDLVVEAVFRNPNSDPSQYWSHGFLLKSNGANNAYWVGYKSTGVWRHFHRLGSGEQLGERNTRTEVIDLTPGALNKLQIVHVDGWAWVYINGTYQGSFAMDADTGGEQVAVYVSDKDLGTTSWEELSVWRWHPAMHVEFAEASPDFVPTLGPTPDPLVPAFGPESGRIPHDPEDSYLAWYSGPNIRGDLMVEVTMEVPFAPNKSHWNFGVMFRSGTNTYHWIHITSKFGGSYVHRRRAGDDADLRGRIAEDLPGLHLQKGDKNHVRVIVVGQDAWLYVNDRRIAILPFTLGDLPNPEEVGLTIRDADTSGYKYTQGTATQFQDFTVWRWHESLFDLPTDD